MNEYTPGRALVLVGLLFTAGMSAGLGVGLLGAERANARNSQIARFEDVFEQIDRAYVDPVDRDAMVDAAIRGMLASLDEHSRWMSAEQAAELSQHRDGAYDGIGVELQTSTEEVRVIGVIPGSPAERAGLGTGDRIVAINGETALTEIDRLTRQLDGPNGETVVLTIQRDGWSEPRELRPVRDRVLVPSVSVARYGKVLYLRLSQFQRGSADDVAAALASEPPFDALVLDLRDNPGGLLDESLKVADLFLADGVIATARSRTNGIEEFSAQPNALSANIPIAVLVNEMSASGSEIVAAALQDSGRAKLVGHATYGKGTVQSVFIYPDQSALKLTTGRYYTPSGKPVTSHQGRAPDVLVDSPASGNIPWSLQADDRLAADTQLQKALSMVTPAPM